MTSKVTDWLNDYINALLGDRSASASAGEAESEEQVRLMKVARRLKYDALDEPLPDPQFAARLENELRRALPAARLQAAGPAPRVVKMPFWNLSWLRPVGGLVAAAAVVLLAVVLLRSVLPGAPAAAPTAALREQGQSAAAPSPAPAPGAADTFSGAKPVAPAPATAASSARPLEDLVRQSETILIGRVVGTSALPAQPAGAPGSPYDLRAVVTVERYLKGPLPDNQVNVLASSRAGTGASFIPGERLVIMTGAPAPAGELPLMPDPQASIDLGPSPQAGAQSPKDAQGRPSEPELIARIEAAVKGQ